LRTMCHVITDVTANHRPSSRTVRVLPVHQFAVRSSLITNTPCILLCFILVSYILCAKWNWWIDNYKVRSMI